jgi:hypothetical protein
LYQPSMNSKMAMHASAWVLKHSDQQLKLEL